MSSELQQLLAEFEPDAHALLAALGVLVDDDDLTEVSQAEAGIRELDHLTALRRIAAAGKAPQNIAWIPGEVCELMRWREPAVFDPAQITAATNAHRREHRQRAFACSILLSSNSQPGGELCNTDAAALIGSAVVLGEPLVTLTARCLAACSLTSAISPSERPFHLLGVLICSLAVQRRPSSDLLNRLANLIEADDALAREIDAFDAHDFLLGLSHFGLRHDLWRSLVQHFLVEPQRPHPPEADAALRRLGRMILDGVKS